MYRRLYGTTEGRNVVLNPVPSQSDFSGIITYKIILSFSTVKQLISIEYTLKLSFLKADTLISV